MAKRSLGRHGKIKSGVGSKHNKWQKGNSCSSNPVTNKYRKKALLRMKDKTVLTKNENQLLTTDMLAVHNEITSGIARMDVAESESAESSATFLSGLSDCSNQTFKKVQRYWQNNQHTELCVVHAAITDVIREKGGTESITDYFATLITSLETVEDIEYKAAVIYLLSMTIKRMPTAVLQAKFGRVAQLLCDVLIKNSENDIDKLPTALVKSTLSSLSSLLHQAGLNIWQTSSCMNIYHTLLSFICYPKPKIRKSAHAGIIKILCTSPLSYANEDIVHPAAKETAVYCNNQLEPSKHLSQSAVCHVLQLLGSVMQVFHKTQLKKSCELILPYMTLSDSVVKSVCLQTICKMFESSPSIKTLPVELNGQIISALYDCHPNSNDPQLSRDWLNVMKNGINNLLKNISKSDEANMLKHVLKFSVAAFKLLLSDNESVCELASKAVGVVLIEFGNFKQSNSGLEETENVLISFCKLLEDCLKYKYQKVWNKICEFYQIIFTKLLSIDDFNLVSGSLKTLADLRSLPNFMHRRELDQALEASIKLFGPQKFLKVIPLLLKGGESDDKDFSRSWIFPLLRQHITGTQLNHFFNYFLPLANNFLKYSQSLEQSDDKVLSVTYKTLHQQCWELFPSYCHKATDVKTAFVAANARRLGLALETESNLRNLIMQGLRNLINDSTSDEDCKNTLRRYSKNFLPILFNLYIDSQLPKDTKNQIVEANRKKSPTQLAALETIRHFTKIVSSGDVKPLFDQLKSRVFSESFDDAQRLAMLDILIALVAKLEEEDIVSIYEYMKPMLGSGHQSLQKKAYRVLEEILSSLNDPCQKFLLNKITELRKIFVDELENRRVTPPSKGSRLNCINQIIIRLSSNDEDQCKDFIQDILPECLSSLRDHQKSKTAAFNLLKSCANLYVQSLEDFFEMIFQGFESSSHMITCCIYALSSLLFDFKPQISAKLIDVTFTHVCAQLSTNVRDHVKAALIFIKILFKDSALIDGYLSPLLDAMRGWKQEMQRHFRRPLRELLEKLLRKFSYDIIESKAPDNLKKQLQHLHKMKARAARKSADKRNVGDNEVTGDDVIKKKTRETMEELLEDSSDDDSEFEEDEKPMKKNRKKKTRSASMLEDAEEDPIDLLDASLSNKIISSSSSMSSSKRAADFRTTEDGRLIIDAGDDNINDDDDVLRSIGKSKSDKPARSALKRKRDDVSDDDDDVMSVATSKASKKSGYKPGGSGIHRDVSGFQDGSVYKNRKAKGDVKVKGHEPYAYLPLDSAVLNRRKQKKLKGQFNGFVKAAKKGASKGAKMKRQKMNN